MRKKLSTLFTLTIGLSFFTVSCNKEEPFTVKKVKNEQSITTEDAKDAIAVEALRGTYACKVNNKAGQGCGLNNASNCRVVTACTELPPIPQDTSQSVIIAKIHEVSLQFAQQWAMQGVIDPSYVQDYANIVAQDLIDYYINGDESNYIQ